MRFNRAPGDISALLGRVHVFNTDFIEESFHWKQGEARPVFYIGKEQAELSQTLSKTTAEIAAKSERLTSVNQRREAADRAFTTLKRNLARNIAEQLGLGRRYDASNLAADYSSRPAQGFDLMADHSLSRIRAVLSQNEPLPKLALLRFSVSNLKALTKTSNELICTSPGQIAMRDLHGHDSMRRWLGEGLQYHKAHNLKDCLFCGGAVPDRRILDLESVIDDSFSSLVENLASLHRDVTALLNDYKSVEPSLPRFSDFDTSLRDEAAEALQDVREGVSRATQLLSTLTLLVTDKQAAPHKQPDDFNPRIIEQAEQAQDRLTVALENLSSYVERHNNVSDRFDQAKAEASSELKHHLLAEGEASFLESQTECLEAQAEAKMIEIELADLRRSEDTLKRALRSHGPAADVITQMIHNYLGRKDLELVAAEEGYRLRRNGRVVQGYLSEGEKTAIAICYFLTTLEAEGRRRKDLIVVMDDPVSSLDTRALNYSFNVIQAVVKDAAQAFLITHNLQFMREARNWLHPKTEKGLLQRDRDPANATASLMLLDTVQPGGPDTRNCVLRELPKHIRDYESEYHYLFHLILQFIASPADTEHFYLIPNALRKTLDVFLAFRQPGSNGLHSKIEKVASTIEGIDPARIRALERLAQVESHADNLDELIAFSTTTVEEVRQAAETLLDFMGRLDGEHLALMRRLCA